ncbi:type II secretion system F family protein [Raineyella sp. LH-20]|uniref:type II secretion system F family protein n=1 Tax=Raineyella sp. LH-20 TaxID=3081204 RepID=UPI002955844F|nr:type II secretion system F family protein [Raineyella sp. LH-20]WOP19624.1 type II secretion system F family protein [Raineyella sp. LH-20]
MTALMALCGALLAAGLWLVVAGLIPGDVPATGRPVTRAAGRTAAQSLPEQWAALTRRPPGRAGRRRDARLLAGVLGGLVAYALTGWVVWLVIVPLTVIALPYLLADPPALTIERLGALDRWVHSLVATLPTGQSIGDAIRTSRRTAPASLAPYLDRVIRRLDQRWTVRDALREMADALAVPEADAVLAALGLAAHRGGTGATATLEALSGSLQQTLAALREIEAERAKPRIVVRQVTAITLGMLAIALVFGRDFFAPYATGVGQVLLLGLVAAYLGSLAMLRRLTRPRPRQRILAGGPS